MDHNARLLEIEHLVQNMDIEAETCPLSQDEWNRKQALRTEHYNILLELEVYWKQRSRIQWLKEGDLNTTFFPQNGKSKEEVQHHIISQH